MKLAMQIVALVLLPLLGGWLIASFAPAKASQSYQIPELYIDSQTGCQYLATLQQGALTPRMGADGKQVCRQGAKP